MAVAPEAVARAACRAFRPGASRSRRLLVETALGDVLHDTVGHEVPDGLPVRDARATVGRRDRQRGHLDQAHDSFWETRVLEVMPGPGHADEMSQLEQIVRPVPAD